MDNWSDQLRHIADRLENDDGDGYVAAACELARLTNEVLLEFLKVRVLSSEGVEGTATLDEALQMIREGTE